MVAQLDERTLGAQSPIATLFRDEVVEEAERWFRKGLAAARQGRLQEARRCFEGLLELQPNEPGALFNLGIVLERIGGKQHEAEQAYRKAVRILQGLPGAQNELAGALNNLGLLLARSDRAAEADVLYRQALKALPDYPPVLVNRAVLLANGREHEAESLVRRALQLEPDLAEAHHVLGRLLARHQRTADAIAEFEEAYQHRDHLSDKGVGLYRVWAVLLLDEGIKAVAGRDLKLTGEWVDSFIALERRAKKDRMLGVVRGTAKGLKDRGVVSRELWPALDDFLVGVKLMAIEDPWERWDALSKEISKVWPKGVSAVDAIREQRE